MNKARRKDWKQWLINPEMSGYQPPARTEIIALLDYVDRLEAGARQAISLENIALTMALMGVKPSESICNILREALASNE